MTPLFVAYNNCRRIITGNKLNERVFQDKNSKGRQIVKFTCPYCKMEAESYILK